MPTETDAKLDALARLREDWDSYDGLPAAPRALETARRICNHPDTQPQPDAIVLASNGGIALNWQTPGLYVEVECLPDGRVETFIAPEGIGGGPPVHFVVPPAREG